MLAMKVSVPAMAVSRSSANKEKNMAIPRSLFLAVLFIVFIDWLSL
jgi:hypothetical protein